MKAAITESLSESRSSHQVKYESQSSSDSDDTVFEECRSNNSSNSEDGSSSSNDTYYSLPDSNDDFVKVMPSVSNPTDCSIANIPAFTSQTEIPAPFLNSSSEKEASPDCSSFVENISTSKDSANTEIQNPEATVSDVGNSSLTEDIADDNDDSGWNTVVKHRSRPHRYRDPRIITGAGFHPRPPTNSRTHLRVNVGTPNVSKANVRSPTHLKSTLASAKSSRTMVETLTPRTERTPTNSRTKVVTHSSYREAAESQTSSRAKQSSVNLEKTTNNSPHFASGTSLPAHYRTEVRNPVNANVGIRPSYSAALANFNTTMGIQTGNKSIAQNQNPTRSTTKSVESFSSMATVSALSETKAKSQATYNAAKSKIDHSKEDINTPISKSEGKRPDCSDVDTVDSSDATVINSRYVVETIDVPPDFNPTVLAPKRPSISVNISSTTNPAAVSSDCPVNPIDILSGSGEKILYEANPWSLESVTFNPTVRSPKINLYPPSESSIEYRRSSNTDSLSEYFSDDASFSETVTTDVPFSTFQSKSYTPYEVENPIQSPKSSSLSQSASTCAQENTRASASFAELQRSKGLYPYPTINLYPESNKQNILLPNVSVPADYYPTDNFRAINNFSKTPGGMNVWPPPEGIKDIKSWYNFHTASYGNKEPSEHLESNEIMISEDNPTSLKTKKINSFSTPPNIIISPPKSPGDDQLLKSSNSQYLPTNYSDINVPFSCETAKEPSNSPSKNVSKLDVNLTYKSKGAKDDQMLLGIQNVPSYYSRTEDTLCQNQAARNIHSISPSLNNTPKSPMEKSTPPKSPHYNNQSSYSDFMNTPSTSANTRSIPGQFQPVNISSSTIYGTEVPADNFGVYSTSDYLHGQNAHNFGAYYPESMFSYYDPYSSIPMTAEHRQISDENFYTNPTEHCRSNAHYDYYKFPEEVTGDSKCLNSVYESYRVNNPHNFDNSYADYRTCYLPFFADVEIRANRYATPNHSFPVHQNLSSVFYQPQTTDHSISRHSLTTPTSLSQFNTRYLHSLESSTTVTQLTPEANFGQQFAVERLTKETYTYPGQLLPAQPFFRQVPYRADSAQTVTNHSLPLQPRIIQPLNRPQLSNQLFACQTNCNPVPAQTFPNRALGNRPFKRLHTSKANLNRPSTTEPFKQLNKIAANIFTNMEHPNTPYSNDKQSGTDNAIPKKSQLGISDELKPSIVVLQNPNTALLEENLKSIPGVSHEQKANLLREETKLTHEAGRTNKSITVGEKSKATQMIQENSSLNPSVSIQQPSQMISESTNICQSIKRDMKQLKISNNSNLKLAEDVSVRKRSLSEKIGLRPGTSRQSVERLQFIPHRSASFPTERRLIGKEHPISPKKLLKKS